MSKSNTLVNKSIAACISGIEIYNKPDFKYREEIFTILIINAWELLLKAKIKKELGKRKLYAYTSKNNTDGRKSSKKIIKRNRSGNPHTIDIKRCMDLISEFETDIDQPFKDNIEALIEIRDNSIHYFNSDNELNKIVLELGTASLKNYLNIIKDWFKIDLSKYNFYLMPLSFFHGFEMINSSSINSKNKQLTNLKNYFSKKISRTESNPENKYNLILNVETKFVKSLISGEVAVKTLKTKEDSETPDLVQEIVLTEEDKSQKYPYSYTILMTKLRSRYIDFVANDNFKDNMKKVKEETNLTYKRLSNYLNPDSQITYYYSTGVLEYFDKIYTKK